ncbi:MAG: hypothetical protein ACREX4_18700 [Gammaproteobacteria bacterium]
MSTSLPAGFRVWVSETAPQGCCEFPPGAAVISPVPLPPPPKTKATFNVGSLKPLRKYYYILTAGYGSDKAGVATGSFNAGITPPKVAGWNIHGTSAVLMLERPPYEIHVGEIIACVDVNPPQITLGQKFINCNHSAGVRYDGHGITVSGYSIMLTFKYLKPNTQYYYEVFWRKLEGGGWLEQKTKGGPIRTKRRIVEISFDRISVYENGDNQDDAHLNFTFWVNGNPVGYYQHDTDDGEKLYPSIKTTVQNAAESIKLEVGVADQDNRCAEGTKNVRLLTIGQDHCHDYGATGERAEYVGPVRNTTSYAPDPDGVEEYERSFNFGDAYPSKLDFRVAGKIRVKYGL